MQPGKGEIAKECVMDVTKTVGELELKKEEIKSYNIYTSLRPQGLENAAE